MGTSKKCTTNEERRSAMFNDKSLMLKVADVLRQENLISFEEQERVKRLIRESEDI